MKNTIMLALAVLSLTGCQEALLGPDADNTPRSNFEILWKTFDEQYPLFTVKHLNWDSLHAVYASRITESTGESQLWDICAGLIAELNDGHVSLWNRGYSRYAASSEIEKRQRDDFSVSLVKSKYLNSVTVAGGGNYTYGTIKPALSSGTIGYMYVASFAPQGSTVGGDWAYDIDRAVRDLQNCDGLIIDLRNNGGGWKVTLSVIVSAFIDREITYFYQRQKTGPAHDQFGEPIALWVAPREGAPRFTKKIALLTNRFSASGSEHFARVFQYLPYATQIGDTTFGCFGDVVNVAQLPNGWTFRYPSRLTTTPEGACFEGIGIVPDILVENTKADIDAGRDNVMDRALSFLGAH